MNFVIKNVHQPSRQEGDPPDRDHHPDLVLCQHVGDAIDVNQPHVRGHTCQGGYCQPEYKSFISNIFHHNSYLPHVEGGHYEEIDPLLHHCGLMPHPLMSFFLREYGLKIKLIV